MDEERSDCSARLSVCLSACLSVRLTDCVCRLRFCLHSTALSMFFPVLYSFQFDPPSLRCSVSESSCKWSGKRSNWNGTECSGTLFKIVAREERGDPVNHMEENLSAPMTVSLICPMPIPSPISASSSFISHTEIIVSLPDHACAQ